MTNSCIAPSPAYAANTPLSDLSTPERLLVITTRLLLVRPPEGVKAPDWRGGLRASGVETNAAPALQALFGVVAAAQRRPLDFRCPCRRDLGDDEGRLLQMVSLYQHGRCGSAEAVLAEWLPPAARRMASQPAHILAVAFERGRLRIPLRRSDDPCPLGAILSRREAAPVRLH